MEVPEPLPLAGRYELEGEGVGDGGFGKPSVAFESKVRKP
jgi:hypothetical protein